MEESLTKGVDSDFLMTKRYGDLLSVESSNIVAELLAATLLDMIEISLELLKLLAADELLNEGVRELNEGGDGIIG